MLGEALHLPHHPLLSAFIQRQRPECSVSTGSTELGNQRIGDLWLKKVSDHRFHAMLFRADSDGGFRS